MPPRRRHVVGGAALGLAAMARTTCFLSPVPGPLVVHREALPVSLSEPTGRQADFGSSSIAPLGLGMVAGACGVLQRAAVRRKGFLEIGQEAPRFKLPDESGNIIDLEELLKKKMQVLIWWYPKANTPG